MSEVMSAHTQEAISTIVSWDLFYKKQKKTS